MLLCKGLVLTTLTKAELVRIDEVSPKNIAAGERYADMSINEDIYQTSLYLSDIDYDYFVAVVTCFPEPPGLTMIRILVRPLA
jgi:hypothetical protein